MNPIDRDAMLARAVALGLRTSRAAPARREMSSDDEGPVAPTRRAQRKTTHQPPIVVKSSDSEDSDTDSVVVVARPATASRRAKRRIVESSDDESDTRSTIVVAHPLDLPVAPAQPAAALAAPVPAAPRVKRPAVKRQRNPDKELFREACELLSAGHKIEQDEARFRQRQQERKAQPWIEVEIPDVAPVVLRAPEFAAAQLWHRFAEVTTRERWLAAHESFFEYRNLYLKMIPVLLQAADSPERTQKLDRVLRRLPELTDHWGDDSARSVESSAWALPWRNFIEGVGSDPFQSGLDALTVLNADIRGKHAIFQDTVDKALDKEDADFLCGKVAFTLEDNGDSVRMPTL